MTEKAHIERIGQPLLRVTVQHNAIAKAILKPLPEMLPQASHLHVANPFFGHRASGAEAHDLQNVLGPRPAARFVPRAVQ